MNQQSAFTAPRAFAESGREGKKLIDFVMRADIEEMDNVVR